MKVLMVDKFYFVKGGAETYMFELSEILESRGHRIIPFAMKHPDNFDTPYKNHFAENVDYDIRSPIKKAMQSFTITTRMIYSFEARKKMERLLEAEKPDIAHLHMIDHQLSPSILHALAKYDVPVIQTVHQYKLMCPNYRFYVPRTQQICEKCLTGKLYNPIFQRCHKNSAIAGAMIALESSLHRWSGIYEKNIDIFHVPSHFMGQKMRQAEVGNGKIRHLFYTIKMDKFKPNFNSDKYILYIGRLTEEKGILTLLKAMKNLPEVFLRVVGEGSTRMQLEEFVSEHNMTNVEFLGNKAGKHLEALVRNSRFVVVPSEWYDNSPLVIYESFAYGKPVIGSNLGGIVELIDHNENGLHFEAGDVQDLTEQISYLWDKPSLGVEFGKAARAKAEREFNPDAHYNEIYRWYQELVYRNNSALVKQT